jgi:hypothetical protein
MEEKKLIETLALNGALLQTVKDIYKNLYRLK